MQYLRADTQVIVHIGPFVDVGDGFTPQVDIDISATNEAELIKHGASDAVVDISGSTWSAITNARGWYDLTITAGNTDTEGQLDVIIQDDSDCLPVHKQFMVVNANVFDSLFAAATTDYLQTDVTQISTDATAANNLELFTEVLENGTGLIDAGTFKAGAIDAAAIADAAIDNATFAADVGSTAYASNIIALAVRKVLDEINLDHLLKVADSDDVADNSVIGQLASTDGDWSNFSKTTDSLQSIRDAIGLIDTSAELLGFLAAVDTTATGATHTTSSVTLTAGKAANNAYNGMMISITDADDGNIETRRIEAWTSGRLATFDRAMSFTPASGDVVRIYAMPYDKLAAVAGGSANTYIVTDSGDGGGTPIPDVSVWVTADAAGARIIASGITDSSGEVVFYLDAGTTYYVWMAKSGYTFSDTGESWLAT